MNQGQRAYQQGQAQRQLFRPAESRCSAGDEASWRRGRQAEPRRGRGMSASGSGRVPAISAPPPRFFLIHHHASEDGMPFDSLPCCCRFSPPFLPFSPLPPKARTLSDTVLGVPVSSAEVTRHAACGRDASEQAVEVREHSTRMVAAMLSVVAAERGGRMPLSPATYVLVGLYERDRPSGTLASRSVLPTRSALAQQVREIRAGQTRQRDVVKKRWSCTPVDDMSLP